MGEILNQMLENYLVSSNVQLQKGPDSLSFTINSAEGISKTTLFNILPYMHLIFFDIHARSLPGEIAENAVYHPMQFNYCVGGRIEMLLDDNSYIYLKEKDFCISRQTSQSESYFPTKYSETPEPSVSRDVKIRKSERRSKRKLDYAETEHPRRKPKILRLGKKQINLHCARLNRIFVPTTR